MQRLGILAVVMGFGMALGSACDRGSKEGELCYSSTADSSDCAKGLVCAKCAEGNICVRTEGQRDEVALRVPGRQCERLTGVADRSEIERGVP